MRARFKRGETFAQVAVALHVPDGGVWANGIAGRNLVQDIKDVITGLETGKVSIETRKGSNSTWYCVMDIEQQDSRSIFDSVFQRQLRRVLEDQRGRYEQVRYLSSLRDRFVTNDIIDRNSLFQCRRRTPDKSTGQWRFRG